MGIAQFSAALSDKAYKFWFNNLTPNVIKEGSKTLRERYEKDPTKNNFLITDEKIKDMAAYVTDGRNISDQEVAQIRQRMLSALKNAKNDGVAYIVKDYTSDPKNSEIVIENVNFQTIETLLENGFGKNKIDGWKRSVGSGFHRGHVLGLPTVLLNQTISKLESNADIEEDLNSFTETKKIGEKSRLLLIDILKKYREELRRQDFLSSNMGASAQSYGIYANYTKDPDSFLIEMQIRKTNVESGSEAGRVVSEMKQVLNPEKMNKGILGKIAETIKKPSVILDFINTPGSPSYTKLVVNKAVKPLLFGSSIDTGNYKIQPVKVAETQTKVKRSKKDIDRHKTEIQKVTKLIQELQSIKARAQSLKPIIDLPMLMMQINNSLHDQIKRNMGTGNRKDVLNYRTGRFAESARVEKISESRQGMITAFYSYMKNPYATFSRGGRQDRPYTRDPKLLISKSIRELAGQQVANRMRAVNI